MTLGNTVALLQNNLKRLLAYSSIAHAGYLMIGVAVAFANEPERAARSTCGSEGILFYLVAYALMTLGAFGVIIALSTPERPVETVDDLAGLGSDPAAAGPGDGDLPVQPGGIPPLAGFWGKFQIFASAFAASPARTTPARSILLAVIGVLNAAIGAYYYLRIVVIMYLRPARLDVRARGGWPVAFAVGVLRDAVAAARPLPRPALGPARGLARRRPPVRPLA